MKNYFVGAVTALAFATSAGAFDVDGFRSGMSKDGLIESAHGKGLDAREGANGTWFIGNFTDSRIDGTFGFCRDTLVSYTRPMDFDADYVSALQSFIAKHGQPRRMETKQNAWSGPGGGYVQSVDIYWYAGGDRINLSFSPEGRDGKGQLRHSRHASMTYTAKNSCYAEF